MAGQIPDKFGKCRVVKMLGQGATAIVYLAKHEGLDIPVAVKVLRKSLSEKRPEYAERFLREARMAAWLEHPNIVRVIDCGIESDYHYMVMDYVDGPNCLEKLQDHPQGLDWLEVTDVVLQAATGLAYAAAKDVIHRDVKPSNLMVDSGGRVRVTDLGLAKLTIKGMVSLTQELHTVGTPNYMSPEQVRSSDDLDLRTDIYSLGASFYHMAVGRPPFTGKNPMEVVAMHLSTPLEPPFRVKPDLPPALSTVISKMMAKDPDERYQDYDGLTADLRNLLEGRDIDAAGFQDSHVKVADDGELQRILGELSFARGMTVDYDDEDESPAGQEDRAPADEMGSTELALFEAEDFRRPYKSAEDPSGDSTVVSTLVREQRRQELRLVIWLLVPLIVALAIFAVLVLALK